MQFRTWMLNQLRRREWTPADLARRLDIPSGTISRWLSGERRPNSRSCDLLADVFGVDVDLVLTLAGHRPAPSPVQPNDRRAELASLLNRVKLTPDRAAGLDATLRAWLEMDKRSCASAATGR